MGSKVKLYPKDQVGVYLKESEERLMIKMQAQSRDARHAYWHRIKIFKKQIRNVRKIES